MKCKVCGDPMKRCSKKRTNWCHTWKHDHISIPDDSNENIKEMKIMKCKICGDPIYNRYSDRWFHTWRHTHWAVQEYAQTDKCPLCGDVIHFNSNKWWHIHDGTCTAKNPTNHLNEIKNNGEDKIMANCVKCGDEIYMGHDRWHHVRGEHDHHAINGEIYTKPTGESEMEIKDNTDKKIVSNFDPDIDIEKQIDYKPSFIDGITGYAFAIKLKNKHQKIVYDAYNSIIDIKQIIENKNKVLQQKESDALSAKSSIEKIKAQLEEYRIKYYTEPVKTLTNNMTETYKLSSEYDKNMFNMDIKTAQQLPNDFNIKNKIKGNFVDEINSNTNTPIPEQKFRNHYPTRTLDEGAKKLINNDEKIQSLEIQKQNDYKTYSENELKKYYNIVKEYKIMRQDFVFNCIEARNRIKFYYQKVEEGNKALSNCGYKNSIFMHIKREEKEYMFHIDTDNHFIKNYEEQIERMIKIYENVEIDESHKDIEY